MAFIPLSVPNVGEEETQKVAQAVSSTWVSTGGAMIADFEDAFAAYLGMPRAVACNSGSSALHLAALISGIQRGDEVIVPTLTFIAAVNPVTRYVGAEPVFIGCDDSLCIDPAAVREFCTDHCQMRQGKLYNKATGAHVSALVVVHVFGNMADMEQLAEIARQFHLVLIEDATEALGTRYTAGKYAGKYAGTIGDVGCYSFNGNKIITTGAGGMVVSNRPDWAARAKHLSTQAKQDVLQFIHDEVGYNYRMTNLQAAMGLCQLAKLEGFIQTKEENYQLYKEKLDGAKGMRLLPFRPDTRSNKWFYSLYLPKGADRDGLMEALSQRQIQTRPIWALIHQQCDYGKNAAYALERALDYRSRIINIPCSTNLTGEEAALVADTILSLM